MLSASHNNTRAIRASRTAGFRIAPNLVIYMKGFQWCVTVKMAHCFRDLSCFITSAFKCFLSATSIVLISSAAAKPHLKENVQNNSPVGVAANPPPPPRLTHNRWIICMNNHRHILYMHVAIFGWRGFLYDTREGNKMRESIACVTLSLRKFKVALKSLLEPVSSRFSQTKPWQR